MGSPLERLVLIPTDDPRRQELERVLRREGWRPLAYQDAVEAETGIATAPAKTVVLLASGDKATPVEIIKKVRHVCPDAFVLGMGSGDRAEGSDAVLSASSTPTEIATAVRFGSAMRDARAAERTLRERLHTMEKESGLLATRIKELETTCSGLEKLARTAQALALHDELTRLYNRRYFFQAANQELERSRRENSRFAVTMIDIDHFKGYNDAYGHLAGDEMLKRLAQTLLDTFRRMDTVARYGGEEFIALVPETHGPNAAPFDPISLMERVRDAVENLTVPNEADERRAGKLTISAGVVLYPEDGKEIADLVNEVDARLYRAKAGGRNRICAARA